VSDNQDTTAPVSVTVKPATIAQALAGQYPDMFAESFRAALVAQALQPQDPASIALRAKLARRARWRRRTRRAALFVVWGCVTSLAILGACWLLGVPHP